MERAKEDAAAAKVQMETEVRDIMLGQLRGRKLASAEANTKAKGEEARLAIEVESKAKAEEV